MSETDTSYFRGFPIPVFQNPSDLKDSATLAIQSYQLFPISQINKDLTSGSLNAWYYPKSFGFRVSLVDANDYLTVTLTVIDDLLGNTPTVASLMNNVTSLETTTIYDIAPEKPDIPYLFSALSKKPFFTQTATGTTVLEYANMEVWQTT